MPSHQQKGERGKVRKGERGLSILLTVIYNSVIAGVLLAIAANELRGERS